MIKDFKSFCKQVCQFNNPQELIMHLYNMVKTENSKLPDQLPVNFDKKDLNKFIESFARMNDEVTTMKFIDLIYKVGHCLGTLKYNTTLTLEDFKIDANLVKEYRQELSKYKNIIDKDLVLKKYLEKAKELLKNNKSSIVSIIKSGARSSDTQLKQMILSKGLLDTGFSTQFIEGNYFEGLSLSDFETSALAARKALYDKTMSTSRPGYLTRQLVYALSHLYIEEDDCGTKNYFPYFVNEDNHKSFYGKYMYNKETNKEELITNTEALIGKTIYVRSALLCQSKNLCRKCVGEYYYPFKHIGIITAQTVGERATQLTLRVFHTGSSVSLQSDITEIINQHSDYLDMQNRIISLKQEAELVLPKDVIISKNNNILLHDTEIIINLENGKTIKFTIMQGSKLLVKPGKVKGNIIQLNPINITNAISAVENFLKMKIVITNFSQLSKLLTITSKLLSYDTTFPQFMYEILILGLLTDENNEPIAINKQLTFPMFKQPIKIMPHYLGIGLLFEDARRALKQRVLSNREPVKSPLLEFLKI